MRILHINTTVSEGASSIYLHKALMKQGIESDVLTVKSDLPYSEHIEELPRAGIMLTGIKILESMRIRRNLRCLDYPFNTSYFGYDLMEYELVRRADIIHLHWICGMLSMKEIAKLAALGKPVVWTCRDIWAYTGGCHIEFEECDGYMSGCTDCPFLKKGSSMASRLIKYKTKWLGDAPVTYIAPSRWMKQNIEQSILSKCNCVHIPNTRDFEVFRPYSDNEINTGLGIDINKDYSQDINILFGATSSKIPYKGFSYLETVAERLLNEDSELAGRIRIHMVGNYDGASRVLSRYKMKSWGFVSDPVKLAYIYSLCDVFVTPSVADNLPSMVMEALGCETPVLAFDTGGTSDMVEHKKNGYIAGYKNEDDFYSGLKWILKNNQDNILGKNGREKMLSEFSYETVARQHIELYKKLYKIDNI